MNEPNPTPVADPRRVVVVGAGPHALTFCVYLLTARPDWHDRLTVIDPDGWITAWNARLARLGITVLRSPGVHHPDPYPYALADFARQRTDELIGDYRAPTARLFHDFCRHLIRVHRLDSIHRCGRVAAIHTGLDGDTALVELASGCRLRADHVVIASNPATPRIPSWATAAHPTRATPCGVVRHADTVDMSQVLPEQRIVVVGGGLTAAQLALGAARAGAQVTLLPPGPLRSSVTDIDPTWLGPHQLRPYFAEPDWERRSQIYHQARRGTIPPSWIEEIHHAADTATLDLHESATITAVHLDGPTATAETTSGPIDADQIWLATGWDHNCRHDPLISSLRPALTTTGLPIIDTALRIPGSAVHLMGAAAALQIGAAAPNLAGARIASERLLTELTGTRPTQYPHPHLPTPAPAQYLQPPPAVAPSAAARTHHPATQRVPHNKKPDRHQPPRQRHAARNPAAHVTPTRPSQ